MIELKTTIRSEREFILRGCEPFKISQSKATWMRHVLNKFAPKYGNIEEMWVLATAAAKAIRYGGSKTIFSFDEKKYRSGTTGCKNTISLVAMKALIGLLEQDGYLTAYVGCSEIHKGKVHNWKSCIHFHDKFLELFPVEKCLVYSQARELDSVEITTGKRHVNKTSTECKGIRGITDLKTPLAKYNELLNNTEVLICGNRAIALYKRVFHESLEQHGRWYTMSTLQTERSFNRKTITINGRPTCEIDYSSMHPRVLAELSGIQLPEGFNCYDVEIDSQLDVATVRELCKHSMFLLMLRATKGQCYSSLAKYARDNDIEHDKDLIHSIIDSMYQHNIMIKDHFFNPTLWMKLQNIDSTIAAHIIEHFTSKGIATLSYHDSFVIDIAHRDELNDVMFTAWEAVLGSNVNCKVKVAYDNTPESSPEAPCEVIMSKASTYTNITRSPIRMLLKSKLNEVQNE